MTKSIKKILKSKKEMIDSRIIYFLRIIEIKKSKKKHEI